ncbi:MAG: Nicotinate phosphoribosyltransferase, partial [uncultured Solirubrobacteraceae bacterium]
ARATVSRGLPAARRTVACGLLQRRVLQLHQGAARSRRASSARPHAGLPEAGLGPGWHRRGDRGAEAVLGHEGAGRRVARRLAGARRSRAARGRRHLASRDGADDRGRLRALRPPRDRVRRLPRAPQPDHGQRARRRARGRRQAGALLPRSSRPLAGADRRRLGRPRGRRDRRLDRRPGLLVGRLRGRNGAPRPDRRLRGRHRGRRARLRAPLRRE